MDEIAELRKHLARLQRERDSNLAEAMAYRTAAKEALDALKLVHIQVRDGEPVTNAIRQLLLEVTRLRPIEQAGREWAKSPFGPKAPALVAALDSAGK